MEHVHIINCHSSKTTFLLVGTLLVLIFPARATSITRRTLRSTDGYDLEDSNDDINHLTLQRSEDLVLHQ